MAHKPYAIEHISSTQYEFVSKGPNGSILKLAEFTPTVIDGIFNLGFGNKREDGSIDDQVEANNNDLPVVFATLLAIINDFSQNHPEIEIFFEGSNSQRTRIYQALLCRYQSMLETTYVLSGFVETENGLVQVDFKPAGGLQYLAFSIARK